MIKQRDDAGTVKIRRKARPSVQLGRAEIHGVIIGLLAGLDDSGNPRVEYPGNALGKLPARATVILSAEDVGREVTLMFEGGDPARPIVIGVVQEPRVPAPQARPVHAEVDGETITFTAEKEIVLQCGKASIRLTRDGKVTIRGAYLLSRSSGVNRIQGGSIQLN